MVGMEFGKLMHIYFHSANIGIHTNWVPTGICRWRSSHFWIRRAEAVASRTADNRAASSPLGLQFPDAAQQQG